jgi:hypothetical protein
MQVNRICNGRIGGIALPRWKKLELVEIDLEGERIVK